MGRFAITKCLVRAALALGLVLGAAACSGDDGDEGERTPPSITGKDGTVETAQCRADAAELRAAQTASLEAEGGYGSIPELVARGYLADAQTSYRAVLIGEPSGGYTLVGAPKRCPDRPVAGPS